MTLMVLLILTILGLSLSLTTHTEALMGTQDRLIHRLFYAADSGIGVATAKVLVENDRRAQTFSVTETRTVPGAGGLTISDIVKTSPFVPILQSPCHLCQINQGNRFFAIHHSLRVEATRIGVAEIGTQDDAVVLGRKSLTVRVDIQPWELTAEAFFVENSDEFMAIK